LARSRSSRSAEWDWQALRAIAYREAQFVLRDPDRANDAAQEATVRAWRRAESCNHAESPGPWIRTIARREALRLAARQQAACASEDSAAVDEPSDLDGRLDIQRALAQLRPLDRRMIVQHYWGAMSCAEIALALRIPEGTVKTRLHRARIALRTALAT
jgi:RNA polymerase sigma-70 factor, ECF subfamily